MNHMKNKPLLDLTLSAVFIAVGMLLPLVTGQIPQINQMLLPMHIPVLMCGLICGWRYGVCVGAILPLLRSMVFGQPVIYPIAIAMTFELSVYGLVTGVLYSQAQRRSLFTLYRSLLVAMLAGRIIRGVAEMILLSVAGNTFTLSVFMIKVVLTSLPGVALQLILIPTIMILIDKTKLLPQLKNTNEKQNNPV